MKDSDKKSLEKAIKILTEQYDKALLNPIVKNPLAYALYHTWKVFDNQL